MPTDGLTITDKIAALCDPRSYPTPPTAIEVVETHMSRIFLTDHDAWKLKKPVRTRFLDFSTIEAREHWCREEVRLNRRLAVDVYLDVIALVRTTDGTLRIAGATNGQDDEIVDWLVRMRRLPASQMLNALIRNHRLHDTEIARLATRLTNFYRQQPRIAVNGDDYRARFEDRICDSLGDLSNPAHGFAPVRLCEVGDHLLVFLDSQSRLLDRRAQAWIVEGHGDLRPEHVCMETPPVIIDCLEFKRAFRILDVADELAFLAMECERLGTTRVGEALFNAWQSCCGDRPPPALLGFYKAASACLRARLAILHLDDTDSDRHAYWRSVAAGYLDTAAYHARSCSAGRQVDQ